MGLGGLYPKKGTLFFGLWMLLLPSALVEEKWGGGRG